MLLTKCVSPALLPCCLIFDAGLRVYKNIKETWPTRAYPDKSGPTFKSLIHVIFTRLWKQTLVWKVSCETSRPQSTNQHVNCTASCGQMFCFTAFSTLVAVGSLNCWKPQVQWLSSLLHVNHLQNASCLGMLVSNRRWHYSVMSLCLLIALIPCDCCCVKGEMATLLFACSCWRFLMEHRRNLSCDFFFFFATWLTLSCSVSLLPWKLAAYRWVACQSASSRRQLLWTPVPVLEEFHSGPGPQFGKRSVWRNAVLYPQIICGVKRRGIFSTLSVYLPLHLS